MSKAARGAAPTLFTTEHGLQGDVPMFEESTLACIEKHQELLVAGYKGRWRIWPERSLTGQYEVHAGYFRAVLRFEPCSDQGIGGTLRFTAERAEAIRIDTGDGVESGDRQHPHQCRADHLFLAVDRGYTWFTSGEAL